jgi:hypothetical protein
MASVVRLLGVENFCWVPDCLVDIGRHSNTFSKSYTIPRSKLTAKQKEALQSASVIGVDMT